MNTDDLPAGRELDALVAEKVMGWQDARAFFPWPESGVMLDNYAMMPPHGGAIRDIAHVPCYSTDIAAAWEVVEKLWDEDFHVQFQLVHQVTAGKWRVEFPTRKVPHHNYVFAHADTASLAICRAALKAVA